MDGNLQPYHAGQAPAPSRPAMATVVAHAHHGLHPHAQPHAKTPGEYVRAVVRRIWAVVAVAVLVALAGSFLILRQRDVYQSTAMISVEPPQFDETLAGLLTHNVGRKGTDSATSYVANQVLKLRSRDLANKVIHDRALDPPPVGVLEPSVEITTKLSVRQQPQTSRYEVMLEGNDPHRVTELLKRLVGAFAEELKVEHTSQIDQLKRKSQERVDAMEKAKRDTEKRIRELVQEARIFAPGGRNPLEEKHTVLSQILAQKKFRFEDLQHEARLAQLYPGLKAPARGVSREEQAIDDLERKREILLDRKDTFRHQARKAHDPAIDAIDDQIRKLNAKIAQIRGKIGPEAGLPDVHAMSVEAASNDIERLTDEVATIFGELRDKAPEYEMYLTLQRDREQEAKAIGVMKEKLADFAMLADSKTDPVRIIQPAVEPVSPVRPNRPLMIAGVVVLGLGLGIGLVCLTESIDRRIREPEPLVHGLALPLLGVVPRIRRSAKLQRGGHLWTPGLPTSVEADAYRNLRASLLGIHEHDEGHIGTLLVTSAKAGEGKSTTALNIAATCARSGERTLLIDVDLRRPSLTGVFEGAGAQKGLVGVLKGQIPWQQTIVRTDLPNLDFLPTGDPRDVPIEILGTMELRQLLLAVSGQYDRVILDGPAVLGLADCRMLGRIVDTAVLVVRAGANELRPLQRAKAMLEQSRVPIAGVIFNGVVENFKDWSSYGPASYQEDDWELASEDEAVAGGRLAIA